jgi:lipoate-protein ligase A
MKLDEKQLPEFLEEMRNLLGNIKGAKGLNETFSLSYIVVVEDQESKENVEKIGSLLTEQAAKSYGIDLEVGAATAEELKEAAEKYKEYQASKNGSFVL